MSRSGMARARRHSRAQFGMTLLLVISFVLTLVTALGGAVAGTPR